MQHHHRQGKVTVEEEQGRRSLVTGTACWGWESFLKREGESRRHETGASESALLLTADASLCLNDPVLGGVISFTQQENAELQIPGREQKANSSAGMECQAQGQEFWAKRILPSPIKSLGKHGA